MTIVKWKAEVVANELDEGSTAIDTLKALFLFYHGNLVEECIHNMKLVTVGFGRMQQYALNSRDSQED